MNTESNILIGGNWKEIVKRYRKYDVSKNIEQLATSVLPYLGIMVLMYFSLDYSYWLTLLLGIVAGGFAVRTFIIFHDCGHGSFFGPKNNQWNNIVGKITGVLTFTPYLHWKRSHARHHVTVADLDKRGEGDMMLMTLKEWEQASGIKRVGYWIYRQPLILFTIGAWLNILVFQRFWFGAMDRKDKLSVLTTNLALVIIIAIVSMIVGFKNYLLIQLPPMMVAASVGVWLFYVQHQFPNAYWARTDEWNKMDACLKGSSYYKLPKALQWITGNIGFHHIHHLDSLIPNYELERCTNENPEFQVNPPVTIKMGMQALGYRLWDEENKEYVGFP